MTSILMRGKNFKSPSLNHLNKFKEKYNHLAEKIREKIKNKKSQFQIEKFN